MRGRERKPRCAACGRKGHVMVDCPDLEPRVPDEVIREAKENPVVQEEMARRRARKWSRGQ